MHVVRSIPAQIPWVRHPPLPSARHRTASAWLLAAALSTCATCVSGTADAAGTPRGASATRVAARPWWTAHGGEALDALVRRAEQQMGRSVRPESAPAAFRVTQAYVALKADTLSLRYIEQARHAARRQHQLILAKALEHDDFARELEQRLRRTDALLLQQTQLRDHDLATLAALCGMSPPDVTALLQPGLDDAVWPSQDFVVPASIPSALLAARPDVALATSLRRTPAPLSPGGAIEPTLPMPGEPGEDTTRGDVRADVPEVLAAARKEVGEALAGLRVHQAVAQSIRRQVAAARTAFEAAQRRRDSDGRFPEVQALEDLQTLLAALRASAIADAELARAWIGLTLALGGTPVMQGVPEPERITPDRAEARAISNLPLGLR
jgi:hypothetical protein